MSHELTQREDGRAEMAYVGRKPWHGLGTKLEGLQQSADMMTEAGLGWTVRPHELITLDGIDVPRHNAIVRCDNQTVLGVAGKTYSPIQNHEVFAFMDSVVGTGEAIYDTAGSIQEGRKIFVGAKLPDTIKATQDDITEEYLVGINSHDGSSSFKVFFTSIRVVCSNTVQFALKNMKESISVHHVGDVAGRVKDAQQILGLSRRYFAEYQTIVDRLVQKQADTEMVAKLIETVFKTDEMDEIGTRTMNNIDKVRDNFESGPENNLPGIKGSAWSLLNSVTQYADHQMQSTAGDNFDKRTNSIFFGSAKEIKQRAFNKVLQLVK